ncbi:hypothetical protein FA13DRAFT_1796504 [Coprinellus micaceus]|uniref:G domain-containing protein n=1 Tax=Coprinellus micaceus TaxID=71717 RepID=A0A4Y7SU64_COPMI|nr:hypothetical protein FA13DRAFT_1796504 [Coprinellus micaceus]
MSYRPIPHFFTALKDIYRAGRSTSNEMLVDLVLICLGRTGCGSSSFVNHLIQGSADPGLELMGVGGGLTSCTTEVRWTQLVPKHPSTSTGKYNIIVGDIPGLNNYSNSALTDFDIIRRILESLRQRIQHGEPFRLGVLLLQDISEQRWPSSSFLEDITWLADHIDPRILRNLTFVTTKWPTMGPVSGQSTSSNQDDPRHRHSELRDLISPLLSAGAELKPCRSEGDEWKIVYEMVDRIDRGSGSFLLPVPKQHLPMRRLFKNLCESFSTRLGGAYVTDLKASQPLGCA